LETPLVALSDHTGAHYVPDPSARAILFRPEADRMIDLGQPTNDQVLARGARPGDRLCVFDLAGDHLGCAGLDAGNNELKLGARADWKPDLIVTPVTSRTLSIAVAMTGVGAPLPAELTALLYPIDSAQPPLSAKLALKGGLYQGTITLTEPALEGYLHVYIENDSEPRREIVTDYTLGGNPAPPRRPPRRSRRRAPGISSDGQVILFADDLDFQAGQIYSIQMATNLPALPSWATAVGQGYRLIASPGAPSLEHVGINMAYAESAVPLGTERGLAIYFQPAGGGAWQRLPTQVNVDRNEAASQLKGPGIYVLMASIDLSLTKVGWNLLFFYPGASQQPVAQALGSIAGKYTTVYGYDDTDAADPWKMYDIGAPGWANDLAGLEYGQGYWIRTTEPVSVSLKPGEQARLASAGAPGGILSAPPATYYGPVLPAPGFIPARGMPVLARVNDTVCGESVTQSLEGQLVFSVNVSAAGTGDTADCGLFGQTVSFEIGGYTLSQTSIWDNSRPRNLGSFVYLSLLRR
jgi:hypothetical protein